MTKNSQSAHLLRLPLSVKAEIERFAKADGTSINQFVATAVAEKLAATHTVEPVAKHRGFDILLAINGEDSDGETMRFAWSLRRVPASQISLIAPHLHRLHIGPARP
jgi:hypothetical protein